MTPTNLPPTPATSPKKRERRKEARPGEIIEAAIAIFAEHGFAAARLDDVARRAGVSKGTLFVYFETKQDLFRAVTRTLLTTHLDRVQQAATDLDRPLGELVPMLLEQAALVGEGQMPSILRLLVAESRAFPDLAQVWHDEVVSKVLGLLTSAIERAQARGEIRPGDPVLHAFSIIGPLFAGALFRVVLGQTNAPLPDLHRLAIQHADTVLGGLLVSGG